jgi:hypothetical protein
MVVTLGVDVSTPIAHHVTAALQQVRALIGFAGFIAKRVR